MELEYILADLQQAARHFWEVASSHRVIAFYGPMGAGKTTFIHALCRQQAVTSPLSSPTFSIINQYHYPEGLLYHIDLYRLKDEEEAIQAGVEDCLYSGARCLVEWPERAPGIFPENTLQVHLRVKDPGTRILTIV